MSDIDDGLPDPNKQIKALETLKTLNLEQLEALTYMFEVSPNALQAILIFQETYHQITGSGAAPIDDVVIPYDDPDDLQGNAGWDSEKAE